MPRLPSRMPVAPVLLLLVACAGSPPPDPAGAEPSPGGADGDEAAPVVQPGAPGEASRRVDPASVADPAGAEHTAADVRFMQGMIHHHAQALDMTALVDGRTDSETLRRVALRIEISQKDEIALMERWLASRGEEVPDWAEPGGHGAHGAGGADSRVAPHRPMMPGMLDGEQMARLAAARDEEFDRLFLEYMIQHHRGALVMVDELFSSPGAAQESEIFRFASDVDADQQAEIARMGLLLERMR